MGLHCIAGICDAELARERLASGKEIGPVERIDLEMLAEGCRGPQPDPWDKTLTWSECPAKAVARRADITDALTLKTLAGMAPLADWPSGYVARHVEIWRMIDNERAALREAARNG